MHTETEAMFKEKKTCEQNNITNFVAHAREGYGLVVFFQVLGAGYLERENKMDGRIGFY